MNTGCIHEGPWTKLERRKKSIYLECSLPNTSQKTKEELKREKKEQKDREKAEKRRKKKEEKRQILLMQAEQEELDAEAGKGEDGGAEDGGQKKEKKVWAKLKYRLRDMQKHAMVIDSIAVSDVNEGEVPIWEMEPSEVCIYAEHTHKQTCA